MTKPTMSAAFRALLARGEVIVKPPSLHDVSPIACFYRNFRMFLIRGLTRRVNIHADSDGE